MFDALERSVVDIEPDDTAARIRQFARDNPDIVRTDEYDGREGTVDGACYCLAESYFHASGGLESPLEIYCLSWKDVRPEGAGTHWYLRDTDRGVWVDLGLEDATAGVHIPFERGRRRAFMTGYEPSKRARRILEALDIEVKV